MAIKYLADDQKMTLDDVLLAVENCLAQLNLVFDSASFAKDDDGEPSEAELVLANATELLGAIQGAVSEFCNGWPTVKIVPALHQQLLHLCQERAEEMDQNFGVDDPNELVASVVNSVVAKAIRKPVDVLAAWRDRVELARRSDLAKSPQAPPTVTQEAISRPATKRARGSRKHAAIARRGKGRAT